VSSVPGPDASPIEVAAAVYAAVRDRDWTRFIALIDPDAADAFKREQRGFAAMALHFAQAPMEHAASDAQGEAAAGSAETSMLRHVFKVRSLDEFDALAPGEVVHRFMRVRYRAPREPTASTTEESLLGVVYESADLAHVIVRTTTHLGEEAVKEPIAFAILGGSSRSWVDILTMQRTPAGWRSQLNGGLITSGGGGFSIGYDSNEDEHSEPPA